MEGRRPPPKASHPYPNVVQIAKFWGTPYAWNFFKFSTGFIVIYSSLFAFNLYLKRNDGNPFKTNLNSEQWLELTETRQASGRYSLMGIRAQFKALDLFASPEERLEGEISFDSPHEEVSVEIHDS